MKIQKRKMNVKRHTTGFKISGKWYTREGAVKLARSGKLNGVRVCKCDSGYYIQSNPQSELKLYNLPTVVAD